MKNDTAKEKKPFNKKKLKYGSVAVVITVVSVSYTHLRAHET